MSDDDKEALQTEVEILSQLSHKAITHLKEVFDTEKVIYMVSISASKQGSHGWYSRLSSPWKVVNCLTGML
jgi:hypothetical protein